MGSLSRWLSWQKESKSGAFSHVRLFATPWAVAHQAPPSMGFSRQGYWSGLPFPSPSGETEFISFVSRITVDGDCSHEIKRCLLLGRKAMTNLDSILKSSDITLPTKVCIIEAIWYEVFPVVMYGCESWTIKKAEH